METLLLNGKWDRLEDFVLYGIPPSHDICFLTKADDAGTQTSNFFLEANIVVRLKLEFVLVKLEIDLTASYEDWIIREIKIFCQMSCGKYGMASNPFKRSPVV